MLTGDVEGRFLEFLVFLAQPRLVLEIGTYSGYSALSMAGALTDSARIVTCEIATEHADVAERHIAAAGMADRIEVRRGPALETIATLDGPFDLVFVDADKPGYLDYYEAVLPKLSAGGLIGVGARQRVDGRAARVQRPRRGRRARRQRDADRARRDHARAPGLKTTRGPCPDGA
jgi:predicted O-methyltransferase YrrM